MKAPALRGFLPPGYNSLANCGASFGICWSSWTGSSDLLGRGSDSLCTALSDQSCDTLPLLYLPGGTTVTSDVNSPKLYNPPRKTSIYSMYSKEKKLIKVKLKKNINVLSKCFICLLGYSLQSQKKVIF